MDAERRYDTQFGSVTLRLERPDDDPFLHRLFRAHSVQAQQLARFPEGTIAKLIDFQYRSQTATYRTLYPNAIYSIIESDGVPIGRFIEEDEGDAVCFVDFAFLPERQAKGLGTAFIRMVADEWGKKGRAARVEVRVANEPSLKLCRKLGFVQIEAPGTGYVVLRREP